MEKPTEETWPNSPHRDAQGRFHTHTRTCHSQLMQKILEYGCLGYEYTKEQNPPGRVGVLGGYLEKLGLWTGLHELQMLGMA